MKSYDDFKVRIRYYGLIPEAIRVEDGTVTGSVPLIHVLAGMQSSSEEPFPFNHWKDPPHLAFANLRTNDLASVAKFTREYGYLAGHKAVDRYRVDLQQLVELQELVQDTWRRLDTDSLATDLDLAEMHLSVTTEGNELRIESLRTLIEILLLRDVAEDRIEICDNQKCITPYFLKSRQGQKCCSRPCVVQVNVDRFRARQKRAMRLLEEKEHRERISRKRRTGR